MKAFKIILIVSKIGIPVASLVYFLIKHWSYIQSFFELINSLK